MENVTTKVRLLNELKHENGALTLWGHHCLLNPIIGLIMKDSLIDQHANPELRKIVNYFTEKAQAFMGVKITAEKFGYAKTLKNKKDLLVFSGGQFELLGYGSAEWGRIDFKDEHFVVRMKSPYASVYREVNGLSPDTVDYWNAGGWAGCLEYILGKKSICIESCCMAQGKPYCEFVIRPEERWDKKDPLVKKNLFVFQDVHPTVGKIRY